MTVVYIQFIYRLLELNTVYWNPYDVRQFSVRCAMTIVYTVLARLACNSALASASLQPRRAACASLSASRATPLARGRAGPRPARRPAQP